MSLVVGERWVANQAYGVKMIFESELRKKKYKIDINESREAWLIHLQEEGAEWVHYKISKDDYKMVENVISLIFGGGSYVLDAIGSDTQYTIYTRGSYRNVTIFNDESLLHESLKRGGMMGSTDSLRAGMPGKIVKVFVKPGDEIKQGQPLLVMEAMKMENELRASHDCKVKEILVKPGDSIESGATLVSFTS